MAVVQELYSGQPVRRPALRRIAQLSLPFEIVFAALALVNLVFAVLIIAVLLFGGLSGVHVLVSPNGGEFVVGDASNYAGVDVSTLPLGSRLMGVIVAAGVLGPLIGALFCLHRLFGAYRRGLVFAEASIRWMRLSGFLLLACAVAPLVLQPLIHAAGLLDQRWFHGKSIMFLIVGGALFVLAQIISLGREIEKEGEEYV